MLLMKKKTYRKLEVLLHFITAFILVIKGCDEINRHLYFPGGIILGLAAIILAINIFWRQFGIKPKQARAVCYYLESPALLITAYILHLEDKEFLPYIFFIAALMYPAMGYITLQPKKKHYRSF